MKFQSDSSYYHPRSKNYRKKSLWISQKFSFTLFSLLLVFKNVPLMNHISNRMFSKTEFLHKNIVKMKFITWIPSIPDLFQSRLSWDAFVTTEGDNYMLNWKKSKHFCLSAAWSILYQFGQLHRRCDEVWRERDRVDIRCWNKLVKLLSLNNEEIN